MFIVRITVSKLFFFIVPYGEQPKQLSKSVILNHCAATLLCVAKYLNCVAKF